MHLLHPDVTWPQERNLVEARRHSWLPSVPTKLDPSIYQTGIYDFYNFKQGRLVSVHFMWQRTPSFKPQPSALKSMRKTQEEKSRKIVTSFFWESTNFHWRKLPEINDEHYHKEKNQRQESLIIKTRMSDVVQLLDSCDDDLVCQWQWRDWTTAIFTRNRYWRHRFGGDTP
jgi:hypothetical protein